MEAFLPDTVKTILLGVLAAGFVLVWLARTFPHAAWLRAFRFPQFQLSEEQQARHRRSANRQAALEIMVAGLVLPFLYFMSTIMLFSEPKTTPMIVVGACSVLCITTGIWILVKNR